MATPRDIHPSIASSATSPRDGKPPPSPPMPSPVTPTQKPSSPPAEEKYARLESLLRQTLALAGEISETKTPLKPARPYARPYTAGDTPAHLPRDCIILRKTSSAEMETPGSGAGTTGGFDVRRHSATAHPRCVVARRSFSSSSFSACCGRGGGGRRNNTREGASSGIRTGGGGGEDEQHDRNRLGGGGGGEPEGSWDSSGASAGSSPSSVQEPFSPETLAQSLDAVVEGAEKEKRRAAKRLRETTGSRPDSAPPTRTSVAASPLPPPPYSPSPGPERPSQGSRLFPSLQTSEAAEPRLAGTSRWYVRIVPLVQRAGQETSSSACLEPPPPPGTPMFMKLEAVFPYPCFAAADGTASSVEDDPAAAAVTTGWDSEGSYIIIGRRPPVVDLSPADDDDDETHFRSCADYRRDHVAPQDRHRQSLQDYIEEWEREAGVTEAETEGSGEGDEMDRMDWAGD